MAGLLRRFPGDLTQGETLAELEDSLREVFRSGATLSRISIAMAVVRAVAELGEFFHVAQCSYRANEGVAPLNMI